MCTRALKSAYTADCRPALVELIAASKKPAKSPPRKSLTIASRTVQITRLRGNVHNFRTVPFDVALCLLASVHKPRSFLFSFFFFLGKTTINDKGARFIKASFRTDTREHSSTFRKILKKKVSLSLLPVINHRHRRKMPRYQKRYVERTFFLILKFRETKLF